MESAAEALEEACFLFVCFWLGREFLGDGHVEASSNEPSKNFVVQLSSVSQSPSHTG